MKQNELSTLGKKAVCSVITKNYIEYLKVFTYSLVKHNPSFCRDYIVFHEPGALSEIDKSSIKKIYKNFIFKEVPMQNYEHLDEHNFQGTNYSKKIRRFAYYRLEMFNLKQYDQVIYFDVDMVVLRNLDILFKKDYPSGILACEDLLIKKGGNKSKEFYEKHHKVQGGTIVVGKSLLNDSTYDDLISMLSNTERFLLADQSMFIEYFGNKNKIQELEIEFNCSRKLVARDWVKVPAIIHYPGSGKPTSSSRTCKTFKYWLKERDEIRSKKLT